MKEEYVSFEQARALKECGFDWECDHFYESDNYLKESTIFSQTFRVSDYWHNFNKYDSNSHRQIYNPYYSAPTLALAQKWLREVKGMDVYVIPRFQNAYEVAAKRLGKVAIDTVFVFDLWDSKRPYPTYESALSAGLDAALELIKQK